MKTHILLIDDDKDELTFLMDALKLVPHDDGFKCTYASNAKQAIEMLQHLVPDVILVDFQMPGTNGLHFLSMVNNQPSLQRTKKYLYSAFVNEIMSKSAVKLGATGCIKKSFKITGLADELEKIISSTPEPAYVFSGLQ
jgi:two-component system, response regulator, stage 0 sporulation protein A